MAHSYEDLLVWQKAMDLVEEVYRLIKLLPKEENFGISAISLCEEIGKMIFSMVARLQSGTRKPDH